MIWHLMHPSVDREVLGLIPDMLNEHDPRPAREQLDDNYQHGGGWRPFKGFTISPNGELCYPDDAPLPVLAETRLRDETIRIYDCAWVAIVQPDGGFEISRMD